jgi:hypothetical protein
MSIRRLLRGTVVLAEHMSEENKVEEDEWYECPVCSYGTNRYWKWLKHGEEHSKKEQENKKISLTFI